MLGAILILVSKSSSPSPVNPQRTSGGTESAKPSSVVTVSPLPLRGFEFETVTVDSRGRVTDRRKVQGQYFVEEINGVALEMVEIPGGTFMMGSPADEAISSDSEGPQHQVSVPTFYMGKYEVTQAQWRAVASLPKVKSDLITNPSAFKGDDLPVEQVSWDDAVEFCERLTRATGRQYRLPSEAEWEYACRAGTTTPFGFGSTITAELVNYDGQNPYAQASQGMYRDKTTPIGYMGVANAFGLFDMHGNVWEWCLDAWHNNYNNAPTDGSAWEKEGDPSKRVMRGGSWDSFAVISRSAYRSWYGPAIRFNTFGFRVVAVARTR
jgi:formylglycine-generating enzyme required for sulfatase activity